MAPCEVSGKGNLEWHQAIDWVEPHARQHIIISQVRSTSDYPDPPATLPLFPVVHKATVISLQHPYTPILRTQYHEMTGWPDRLIDRLIAAINYRRMEVKRQNYIVSCDRGLTNRIKS